MYSLEQIVDDNFPVNEGAIEALQAFKDARTDNSTNRGQRLPAMQVLIDKLSELDHLHEQQPSIKIIVKHDEPEQLPYMSNGRLIYTIALFGRLSIISLLNAYGRVCQHIQGEPDDFLARQRFAINLFRKVYPNQFAELEFHPDSGGFSKSGRTLGYRAAIQMVQPPQYNPWEHQDVAEEVPVDEASPEPEGSHYEGETHSTSFNPFPVTESDPDDDDDEDRLGNEEHEEWDPDNSPER